MSFRGADALPSYYENALYRDPGVNKMDKSGNSPRYQEGGVMGVDVGLVRHRQNVGNINVAAKSFDALA